MSYKGQVPHGTNTCYRRGCRERICLDAHRDHNRQLRLRAGSPEVGAAVDTFPAKDCGICFSPLSEHHPYFAHVRTA